MKAYRTLTVRPQPPAALAGIEELVRNLHWTWHTPTRELLRSIDPTGWDTAGGDPLALLASVDADRLDALAADPLFRQRLDRARTSLREYLAGDGWFDRQVAAGEATAPAADGIAYFSMEFGISDVLPNFSGGLGVLAGDHLKSASDLGVPLVGLGLFYRFGYFAQSLSADGWQQENYSSHDPHSLAMELVRHDDSTALTISVEMPQGPPLSARVWQVNVGRVPLLLLDSDVDANNDRLRQTTDKLYGGDQDHRIRQEILLGIGGMRALRAWCALRGRPVPTVVHMNEGHAGFSGLERMSALVTEQRRSPQAALAIVRAGTVFTTHTPVPAGIDRFPADLVRHYLSEGTDGTSRLLPGLPVADILDLGREDADDRFNMAHLGLRLAQRANGVAQLHGRVSRRMFAALYPGFDDDEVPIGAVTNGVHLATWQDQRMRHICQRMAGADELEAVGQWPHPDSADPAELWGERSRLRAELVDRAREVLRRSWIHRGRSAVEAGWIETALDPDVLTIGFARRVSTYKRLTLMLHDRERLRQLLLDPDRPIQIVIAGKAHPADDAGKQLMQEMVLFADDPQVRHRVVFLPNYSMSMAKVLCAGADVWLNNPIRPQEASGTSGMKAALNGALNLSISDGWWDELFDGHDGWVIPSADVPDDARRDELEAAALYELLEDRVVPLFYDRGDDGVPGPWMDMVRHTLGYLGSRVPATRMVRDYVTGYYAPAAAVTRTLTADTSTAEGFAQWQDRVRQAWAGTRIRSIDVSGIDIEPALGHEMTIRADVDLAQLEVGDVQVQAVMGRPDGEGQLREPVLIDMSHIGPGDGQRFEARIPLDRAGSVGYTVRVVPRHRLLSSIAEMGLVTMPGT